jgi:hypothetical protein
MTSPCLVSGVQCLPFTCPNTTGGPGGGHPSTALSAVVLTVLVTHFTRSPSSLMVTPAVAQATSGCLDSDFLYIARGSAASNVSPSTLMLVPASVSSGLTYHGTGLTA